MNIEAPTLLKMAVSRLFGGSLEAYLKAKLEQEVRDAKAPVFRGSITVSRQAGCRALPVCELLAGLLREEAGDTEGEGWLVHDKDIVEHIIEENHLPPYLAEHLAEEAPDAFEDFLAELLDVRPSDWTLFQNTVSTIRNLARLGDAVIIGRGGNFITADMKNCFHVRLVGDEKERLEVLRETHDVGDGEAAACLKRLDQDRLGYVRSHLDKDAADPLGYHLVLNTNDTSEGQLARMIAEVYFAWRDDRTGDQEARKGE